MSDNFKNGRVQDFFLPEMNLLSLVPDMTIMYILGKIGERLGGNSTNLINISNSVNASNSPNTSNSPNISPNTSNPSNLPNSKLSSSKLSENSSKLSESNEFSDSKENIDPPKTRNHRDSRFSSSDAPESTISAPTMSTMMQPTGGLSRAQRKTSSLSGMLGTTSHDRRNRIIDLDKDIKMPDEDKHVFNGGKLTHEKLVQKSVENSIILETEIITPNSKACFSGSKPLPIPKPRSRNNIAKASRDSGLSDESCVFEKSELKLVPQASRVEILSGSHGIMVGLKKVDNDTRSEVRSEVSSSDSSKHEKINKIVPVAPVRHESRTQKVNSVQSSQNVSNISSNFEKFNLVNSNLQNSTLRIRLKFCRASLSHPRRFLRHRAVLRHFHYQLPAAL